MTFSSTVGLPPPRPPPGPPGPPAPPRPRPPPPPGPAGAVVPSCTFPAPGGGSGPTRLRVTATGGRRAHALRLSCRVPLPSEKSTPHPPLAGGFGHPKFVLGSTRLAEGVYCR